MKKERPRKTATPVMRRMKCSISMAMGVRPTSSPEASEAMRPITVRSPVEMTMPRAVPSTQLVEKKQMLRVSSGFSWVNSGERVWGSDSPVSEELSTLQPWEEMMRMSAGTRSPPFTSTRSPTTTFSALIWIFSPSRITRACWGTMFLKESMILELLASW